MEQELDFEQLRESADRNIETAKDLIKVLDKYAIVPGALKVQRAIKQEIKCLEKVIRNGTLSRNHVQCSNLTHYDFLVKVLQLQRDLTQISANLSVEGRESPLNVDIICDNGLTWIKAIARNPRSLIDAVRGEVSYGAKSIFDQAEEFYSAAAASPLMFQTPKVVFYFSHQIEHEVLKELEATGIEIATLAQPAPSADIANISTLNLDITTLLAYISAICNNGANYTFKEPILTEQAAKERETPLKPVLDELFEGKRLICCETAWKSFAEIVSVLAGPQEKQRADDLMRRVEVLPDVESMPPALVAIKCSGKVNPRSLKIFAFGMQMKALTVTSNKGCVRGAKMQGINFPVFTHQARALTEAKESEAEVIS